MLHCVSAYPTPAGAENLRAIRTLADAFRMPVGLSDHGGGLPSAVAAVALGARIYERHLVLPGDTEAIDAAVSSTPAELKAIVQAMEHTRDRARHGRKLCQPAEAVNVTASRRGLYAARALRAGERVARADVDRAAAGHHVSRRSRSTRWSARRSVATSGRGRRSARRPGGHVRRATRDARDEHPHHRGSRRVPLVQAFRNALRSLGVPGASW